MFLQLTENYIASKFFQNCGKPFYNRSQKTYQGSCPICREGSSWLKKRRCYYIVSKNIVCCHNCGWYSSPYNWIVKVTGLNYSAIKKELENFDTPIFSTRQEEKQPKKEIEGVECLPSDSINLFDDKQIEYYSQNQIIRQAINLLQSRRLVTAINKPAAFYISLTDKVHDNRLVIPFYGDDNKIIHYQTRTVLDNDTRPKYLSKVGSEKSLYGINTVNSDLEYLFITEGPIDAMFLQNGIAVAGINESRTKNFTDIQKQQLNGYPLHKKVWVLDNQYNDKTSKQKTKNLLDAGENVFIWPENLKDYKDLNEYCIDKNCDSFDRDIILNNTYSGLKGKLLLTSRCSQQ